MAEYESLVGLINADRNMQGTMNLPQRGGASDYEDLNNKPQIEGVTLIGNKTFEDLTLFGLSNIEIYDIVNGTNLLGE